MLDALRTKIYRLHLEMSKNKLVTWTTGNLSGRDAASGLVVIKPSGLRYETLSPESMVVVDLDGRIVEGSFKPSSDLIAHLYIYRRRPDVGGVVHTHSTFATAFSAVGMPLLPYLLTTCDEFGGPVPCADFAIESEEIGRAVVDAIGNSPAVLLKQHGVFTIGPTPEEALRAAVMVEDLARKTYFALQLGQPEVIPPEKVDQARRLFLEKYGQRPELQNH